MVLCFRNQFILPFLFSGWVGGGDELLASAGFLCVGIFGTGFFFFRSLGPTLVISFFLLLLLLFEFEMKRGMSSFFFPFPYFLLMTLILIFYYYFILNFYRWCWLRVLTDCFFLFTRLQVMHVAYSS